jgi:segregation and condensation protein A
MDAMGIAEIPLDELLGEGWEGTLRRLTQDMDPWDIDVAELARRYRHMIEALRELRFEIPGRMVLTCSILLRMQSDDLLATARPTPQNELFDELEQAVEEEASVWEEPVSPPEFSLPLLRQPRRQVTLSDLCRALASAMRVSSRRTARHRARIEADDEDDSLFDQFEIGGDGFGDRLLHLVERIKHLLSGVRAISFFRLLERGDKEERIERFLEVLHLAAQGEIACSQEEFLGDILITLPQEG